jgi:hypothetical protein
MALHETLKNAKIVEEIFAYLLEKGCPKINVSLEIKDKETTFIVIIDYNEKLLKKLKSDIYCCRDQELEEYGWELMGENECEELHTLGMLIDNYETTVENDLVTIVFHRLK